MSFGLSKGISPQPEPPRGKASPAEGYNVHVLAPHVVSGKQMGPYHHYGKVIAPDPQDSS